MTTIERLRKTVESLRILGAHESAAVEFTLTFGDCAELLHEIDRLRADAAEAREACARICDERARMNASMGRKALALESGACADSIRYGG